MPLMRSSCRSMTMTRGRSRPAISTASAPSEQVITVFPSALSRYAIRSLLALLSSTTRMRLSLTVAMFLRGDEGECAASTELARELDAAPKDCSQTLADVKAEARTLSGRSAELPELFERLEQLGLILLLDADARVDHLEPDRGLTVGG